MSQPVVVHIGMASAAARLLQGEYFPKAPGINYLGKQSVDNQPHHYELTRRRSEKFDPAETSRMIWAALQVPGVPVLSHEGLTSYGLFDPTELAARVRATLPPTRLLFITRRLNDWATQFYFDRLARMQPDTMPGLSPWLEKHTSQFKVGSELAQGRFAHTARAFHEASRAQQMLILPYELLTLDPLTFLSHLDSYIGLDGELAKLAREGAPLVADRPMSRLTADAARALGLAKTDPDRFRHFASVLAQATSGRDRQMYARLIEDPAAGVKQWAPWWQRAVAAMEEAAPADPDLAPQFDVHDDYFVRDGLSRFLNEIEAQETELMLAWYGVDLRGFGYGQSA